jgi:hypothetical protein
VRTDLYGSEIVISDDAAPLWDEALRTAFRLDDDSDARLAMALGADPTFCLGHAYAAVLADEGGEHGEATASIGLARTCADRACDRERSYLAVAEVQVRDGYWAISTESAWRRHNADFPGDVLGVEQVLGYAYFGARDGSAEALHDLVSRLRDAVGDVAPVREQLGWSAHESGRTDEAHAWADSLLDEDPRWIGAAHVHAHAFYEAEDHAAGARWIDDWFERPGHQSYAWHLSWHAGLHHLALGDEADLLPRFLREMRRENPRLGDGAMALWRDQLLGIWPPGEDPSGILGDRARDRAEAPELLMAGWVSALGLAAVGDAESLRALAARTPDFVWPGATELLAPLATGLAAWVEGDPAAAASDLTPLAQRFDRFGGSVAQLDTLRDTYVAVLAAAGRDEEALAYVEACDSSRPVRRDRRLLRADLGRPATRH